jgi:NAD(P)-dependent dehydrogenase (short-subunit alcohol dehydrogenase family)
MNETEAPSPPDLFPAGGAFVLGGSGGLGSAICEAFAQAGVPVAFSYRSDEASAQRVADMIESHGVQARRYTVDARDRAVVADALSNAAHDLGGLHSIVYAAGPPFSPEFFGRTSDDTWRAWLEGDVLAAIHLAQEAIVHLRRSRGAFLTLSTYQGDMIEVRGGTSAISKAALDRMVAVIAKEEGRYGVRANSLRCGWISSRTNDQLLAAMPDLAKSKRRSIPLGRLGLPEEIGQTVLFLCSRRAGFITGQTITADGGEAV